ncbi:hypothetical protein KJ671_02595 [Patescibacteria group bacterium]|nr:hypothetical protein [Patescibacteria group bacterium]
MQDLEKIIKQFKKVGPSEEYKTQSLQLILNTPQNQKSIISIKIKEVLKFGLALGLTGALITISLSDVFYTLNARFLSPIFLSSLSEENLKKEAGQIDIKITISEAKYYSGSLNKVAAALNEATQNGPGHLNSSILEKEIRGLNIDEENNNNIDKLLNKLIL